MKKLRGKEKLLSVARCVKNTPAPLAPVRHRAAEALALERQISDLVNAAYGLTPEEVKLMWQTAPPRMPVGPNSM